MLKKDKDLRNNADRDSILLWTKQKRVKEITEAYAAAHGLNIIYASTIIDFIMIPCLLTVVDTQELRTDDLELFNQHVKYRDPDTFRIVIAGKKLNDAPEYVSKVMIKLPRNFNADFFDNLLYGKGGLLTSEKKNHKSIQNSRIYRIMTLYHFLKYGNIDSETFCALFDINERTLRRDIKDLNEVSDKFTIEGCGGGMHYLNNKNN